MRDDLQATDGLGGRLDSGYGGRADQRPIVIHDADDDAGGQQQPHSADGIDPMESDSSCVRPAHSPDPNSCRSLYSGTFTPVRCILTATVTLCGESFSRLRIFRSPAGSWRSPGLVSPGDSRLPSCLYSQSYGLLNEEFLYADMRALMGNNAFFSFFACAAHETGKSTGGTDCPERRQEGYPVAVAQRNIGRHLVFLHRIKIRHVNTLYGR